jgi:hypothetical protein
MALGSLSKPAGPSTAMMGPTTFDNSGFVVNVGGSAASTKTALPSAAQAVGAASAGLGALLSNPVIVIGIGLGLFLYLKHK